VGPTIANCRFSIADLFIPSIAFVGLGFVLSIGNWQSAIGNRLTHPLPRGGTDFNSTELSFLTSTPTEHYRAQHV